MSLLFPFGQRTLVGTSVVVTRTPVGGESQGVSIGRSVWVFPVLLQCGGTLAESMQRSRRLFQSNITSGSLSDFFFLRGSVWPQKILQLFFFFISHIQQCSPRPVKRCVKLTPFPFNAPTGSPPFAQNYQVVKKKKKDVGSEMKGTGQK